MHDRMSEGDEYDEGVNLEWDNYQEKLNQHDVLAGLLAAQLRLFFPICMPSSVASILSLWSLYLQKKKVFIYFLISIKPAPLLCKVAN